MSVNTALLAGYGLFLLIILLINLLYFFQVFQYRLPGDVSIKILSLHTILLVSTLVISTLLMGVL
jgi:hypothetical protein